MSCWLHVAGVIRVDAFRLDDNPELNFNKLIGKECLWSSDERVWNDQEKHPEKYLPMGSEGSLHKTIWKNPSKSEVPAYTVTIFGDLRDKSNAEEIIAWFKEKCKQVWVRNAVITVSGGYEGIKTWTYTGED